MVEIGDDQETIYITRGDEPVFSKLAFYLFIYNAETDQEENYKFKLTDKISFCVKEKKRIWKRRYHKN